MSKQKNNEQKSSRDLILKDDFTEYGTVTKKLGNGRFSVRLNMQNKEVIGRLCGKLKRGSQKRQNWVEDNSVVLVGFRDFQDNIVDIVHVYDSNEVRQLRKNLEIIDDNKDDSNYNRVTDKEEEAFIFDEI